jgi:hypothetical protein
MQGVWLEVFAGNGAGVRIGPAGEVEHRVLLLGRKAIVAGDGGESAEEEAASVGHDGGAAGSDLVAGLELIEFAEGVVDVGGGAEFLNVTDEGGGEVGLVEVPLMFGGVFDAQAGIRIRDGHAATASAGGAVPTMERERVGVAIARLLANRRSIGGTR